MITIPTVLILGAGTSMNYGFPSGASLKAMVLDKLKKESGQIELGGFNRVQIDEFQKALGRSGQLSVDAFLEHRPNFVDLGKYAMAAVLCPLENIVNLFENVSDKDNWYEYLFGRLGASFDQFGDNKLSVITYNFDRSLEAFLHTALKNSYGRNDADILDALKAIPIIHLHGQLGPLLWQDPTNGRDYCPTTDPGELGRAAGAIKIISDTFDLNNDAAFQEASRVLKNAQRIVFLGFGYNQTNLSRIKDCFEPNQEVLGSFYKFTQLEVVDIRKTFAALRKTPDPVIRPGHDTWQTLAFLREMVSL